VTAASFTAPGRRVARELGLQILLLLGTLLLAEVVLRIADLRELRDGYSVGASTVYRYDAELGWRPIPNAASLYRGAQTVSIKTNSIGLCDIEHDRSPKQTVLFLGDPFTWAMTSRPSSASPSCCATCSRTHASSTPASSATAPIRNTCCSTRSGTRSSPMWSC
jgi:hypothetical protein